MKDRVMKTMLNSFLMVTLSILQIQTMFGRRIQK